MTRKSNLAFLVQHLCATMAEHDADLKERLHPTAVQKLADARQDVEQELANPTDPVEFQYAESSAPCEPTLPPMLKDLLDRALAELDRRATSEAASLAVATRLAEATERQAVAMEAMVQQYQALAASVTAPKA